MSDIMIFADRAQLRAWLNDNCLSSEGVWLLFGKPGGPKTVKAGEALEEALARHVVFTSFLRCIV